MYGFVSGSLQTTLYCAAGDVSEPIPRGNALWILRVAARREGLDQAFSDPGVQAHILEQLGPRSAH